MKRLYSIFLIMLIAGCAPALEQAPTALATVPPEWLTKPPTPMLKQSLGEAVATQDMQPASTATTPATAMPAPTEASLLGALLDGGQPESSPLRLSTAAGVPAKIVEQAQQLALAQPESFSWVEPGGAADVTLTIDDGAPLASWTYVAAGPFATVPDGVSSEELKTLWTAVSPPEMPLMLTAEGASTLAALWGAPGPALTIVEEAELREQVWAQRPSRTIVPFERLTPDLKVLAVDGRSPLEDGFEGLEYPLMVHVTAKGEETAVEQFLGQWNGAISNFDAEKLTTVAMTGVTALVRATATQMEIDGILTPARDVGPVLRGADFAHVSNEVSFAADCPEPNPIGGTSFCSQDEYFALLTEIGTDIVELTGNHLNDWGTDNLLRTMDMYDAAGLQTFGGGRNATEAATPLLLEHNGNRIALVGCNYFGPAYAWATDVSAGSGICGPEFLDQVRELKEQGYTVIATQQYTEYYQYAAPPDQAADFEEIAAAGADAVSGSQGHHAMGFEFSGDSFIHYGLGNLFFDQMDMLGTRQAFVDTYSVYDGRLVNVALWTGLIENYFLPRLMTAEEREQTLQTVFEASGW